MARHKPCFTAIKSRGVGAAPPEMRWDHPRHHRTPQTRHALLRKTWLPPLGKDFRLFRHAFVRIPETIAARRHSRLLTGALLRPSTWPKLSRSGRQPGIFLLSSFSPSTHPHNPLTISPHIASPPRRLNHEPRHYNQKIHCRHFRVGPSPSAKAHSRPVANSFPRPSRPQ